MSDENSRGVEGNGAGRWVGDGRDCPGGGKAATSWGGCSECGCRADNPGEGLPPHRPAPPPDMVFWWLVTLKAEVSKLAALDVTNAVYQLDGLRRELGLAVARIDALEAVERQTQGLGRLPGAPARRVSPAGAAFWGKERERLATAQDDHDFCARAESSTRHVGLFTVPTTREGWLAWAREAQRVAASIMATDECREECQHFIAIRSGGPGLCNAGKSFLAGSDGRCDAFARSAFGGLDRSVRSAADVPRDNPGGMTAEDFRRAAEKPQPRHPPRQDIYVPGFPCPRFGCQGILAKDYAGGLPWCPECRSREAEAVR